MRTEVEVHAVDVTVWRGYRASGDLMSGRAALVIRGANGLSVSIVGMPSELADLRERIYAAMTSEQW